MSPAPETRPVHSGGSTVFEYVGRTALVVDGPYTKRRYRFDRPGSRIEVDSRDAPALGAISALRQV
jgi:hypothetical protein